MKRVRELNLTLIIYICVCRVKRQFLCVFSHYFNDELASRHVFERQKVKGLNEIF
jgi:hypothetical protein